MPFRSAAVGVVLASCLVAPIAVAQEMPGQRQVRLGVTGGADFSTFTGSDGSGSSTRTGFFAGAVLSVPLGPSLSFAPQAVYITKGAKDQVGGAIKLSYFEVPVLFALRVPIGKGGPAPVLFAGPTVAFLSSCSVSAAGVSVSCESLGYGTNSFELGATVGAGFGFPLGVARFEVFGRYGMGLTKVFDVASTSNVKNGVFSVGAAYFFKPRR